MRRLPGLVAMAVVLGFAAAACSVPGFGNKPDKTFDALAKALSARQVGAVPFVGATGQVVERKLSAILASVGDLPAVVQAGSVTSSGNTATADLTWTWSISGRNWTYVTKATTTKVGGNWQVDWSPSLVEPTLRQGDTLVESTISAQRGDIIGADSTPLVMPRPVTTFGIDKTEVAVQREAGSAARLAALLGIDPAAYTKAVRAAGPKAFVPALVLRRADVTSAIRNGYGAIPGAVTIDGELPLAPTKEFAAALLGTVGPATAEIIKLSKGRIRAGDEVGLSGLEQRYDAQLAGTRGTQVRAVSAKGVARTLFSAPAVAGHSIRITLDRSLETVAQDALAKVGPASAIVAIQPSTGAVLAVASGPGSNGYNTATIGQYAPGSTFKVVTSLALLRAGLSENTVVPCGPEQDVDGKVFKNYSDYPPDRTGNIALKVAFANSCNTAFISQRHRITPAQLKSAAASLGFGVDHDTGFPSFFGELPATAGETTRAADMIGQGQVLASPFGMAVVAASVVRGAAVVPHLMVSPPAPASAAAGTQLTAKEHRELEDMMRAVVTEGSGVVLGGLPGPPVLAKTGTAEYGTTLPLPTHAWMIAAHGDLAVAVFVADGATGAGVAGPILRQFLEAAH